MITILACNPTFGAAYNLRRAFSLWEETRLIILATHPLWPGEEDIILTADNADYCRSLIEQSRFTMLADAAGQIEILKLLGQLKANFVAFWGDTEYWQNPELYNDLAQRLGIKTIFAMMDIVPKAPAGAIPLCHPVEDLPTHLKAGQLTIAHSPRTENKRKLKGSDAIERAISRLYLDYPHLRYMTITGLPWRDCLILKSQAHIFIDQIPGEGMAAGLGRSGEEALAFGSVVLTALNGEQYLKGFFPPPPVIRVYDEIQLHTELNRLCVMSMANLEGWGRESRAWAEEYLLFPSWLEYVGRYVN